MVPVLVTPVQHSTGGIMLSHCTSTSIVGLRPQGYMIAVTRYIVGGGRISLTCGSIQLYITISSIIRFRCQCRSRERQARTSRLSTRAASRVRVPHSIVSTTHAHAPSWPRDQHTAQSRRPLSTRPLHKSASRQARADKPLTNKPGRARITRMGSTEPVVPRRSAARCVPHG